MLEILRVLLKKKCILCGKRDYKENLRKEAFFISSIFYDYRPVVYFHESCVRGIILNPELFSERKINEAIDLKEMGDNREKLNDYRRKVFNDKISKFQQEFREKDKE
jgi:hypothetical protein